MIKRKYASIQRNPIKNVERVAFDTCKIWRWALGKQISDSTEWKM